MNKKIVVLPGPEKTTFSELAYLKMERCYDAQPIYHRDTRVIDVGSEENVFPTLLYSGGHGVVVAGVGNAGLPAQLAHLFMEAIEKFNDKNCPIDIAGAMKIKNKPALMADSDLKGISRVKKIFVCPEVGICDRIKKMNVEVVNIGSNEIVRVVNELNLFSAILGPNMISEKYNLNILENDFRGSEVVNLYFLIRPRIKHGVIFEVGGCNNEAMFVSMIKNIPGSLGKVIDPFRKMKINITSIYSSAVGEVCNLVIQLEYMTGRFEDFWSAMERAKKNTISHVIFGPFHVSDDNQ